MLIRLLCVYIMTEYVGKILFSNSKRLMRKLQKNFRGYFLAAPCSCQRNFTDVFVILPLSNFCFKGK